MTLTDVNPFEKSCFLYVEEQKLIEENIPRSTCTTFGAYYENTIPSNENPENDYIAKETLLRLSSEARLMMETILNLPEEMFDSSGRIILRELSSWMHRKYRWNKKLIIKARDELAQVYGERI